MKLSEWLSHAEARLRSVGIDAPRLEAQVLAAHVLRVERSWLFAHPEHDFNELAGEQVLQRRESHEPLAYILGWREFYARRFEVNPAVLIPRQETEALVETALRHAGAHSRVLDVGTGSGCIATTLKLERPSLQVTALDISPAALEVARRNADTLGAEVSFLESDGFAALAAQVFDLIVTNPPYIGRSEPLMPEVRDFEPELALFGGVEGDEFLRRLAVEAQGHLVPKGLLITEVGYQQMSHTIGLFEAQGWQLLERVTDLSGIERVAVFSRQ